MFLESFENQPEEDPAGVKVFLDFLNNGGLSPSTSPSDETSVSSEAPSEAPSVVVMGGDDDEGTIINNSTRTAEEDASLSTFLDSFIIEDDNNETNDGRGENATADKAVESFLDYVEDNNITGDHPSYIAIIEPNITIDVVVVLNFDR